MLPALTIAHVVIATLLVILVLIQDSKGDASGLLGGGGGSNSLFGATGAASFLVQATRSIAVLFAISCLVLAYVTSTGGSSRSVIDRVQGGAPLENSAPLETQKTEDVVPAESVQEPATTAPDETTK